MITLASDFGTPYPAAMKGVLLSTSRSRQRDGGTGPQLIDVSHDLPRGDVRASAFWLRFVLPEFPPAVHLVVVDPGVGTDRAALVVRAGEHVLVGPDNGVLLPAARALAADRPPGRDDERDSIDVFEIEVENPASATFHGRDVFAPAAALAHDVGSEHLATVDQFTPVDEYVDYQLPTASLDGERAVGTVLAVDDFGNVITNVPGSFLDDEERDAVSAGAGADEGAGAGAGEGAGASENEGSDAGDTILVNDEPVPVVRTFAAVPPGDRLVTVGSHGYLECDVNQGRGADAFDLEPGDRVVFYR